MELQDLVVRGVLGVTRFPPSAKFVDSRSAIIEAVQGMHDLPHWSYGGDNVDVFREDRTLSVAVTSREVRISFESDDDLDAIVSAGRRTIDEVLSLLGVPEVVFVGAETYWIAASDDFEELNAWMSESLGGKALEIANLVDKPVSDCGWVFDFMGEGDPKFHLRLGPMTREQAHQQFFRHHDKEVDPDVFLFLDIDRFVNEPPIEVSTATALWEETLRANFDLGRAIGRFLEEAATSS